MNANFIRGWDGNHRTYIGAMGPLPSTAEVFWRMNVQNNVRVIIMATNLVEKGVPKCDRVLAQRHGQQDFVWQDRRDHPGARHV